ncbi:MAG: hypothetical protein MJA27_06320 [Pseudanabaenales cyanobacterium]|nr:hypothetical protein [Pseudanabaenales cyanobacterium]
MALGRIGSEAATAVSALVEACQDPVPEVRGMGYPTHRHP